MVQISMKVVEFSALFDEMAQQENTRERSESDAAKETDTYHKSRLMGKVYQALQRIKEIQRTIDLAVFDPYDVLSLPGNADGKDIHDAYINKSLEMSDLQHHWAQIAERERAATHIDRLPYYHALSRADYYDKMCQHVTKSYKMLSALKPYTPKTFWGTLQFWKK